MKGQKQDKATTKSASKPLSVDQTGYKKPPKHSQWKKGGPSPNPGGRRKKPLTFKELMTKIAMEKVTLRGGDGRIQEMTKAEALIQRIFSAAMNGDIKAAREAIKLLANSDFVAEREMTDDEINSYELSKLTREELYEIEKISKDLAAYRVPREEFNTDPPTDHAD